MGEELYAQLFFLFNQFSPIDSVQEDNNFTWNNFVKLAFGNSIILTSNLIFFSIKKSLFPVLFLDFLAKREQLLTISWNQFHQSLSNWVLSLKEMIEVSFEWSATDDQVIEFKMLIRIWNPDQIQMFSNFFRWEPDAFTFKVNKNRRSFYSKSTKTDGRKTLGCDRFWRSKSNENRQFLFFILIKFKNLNSGRLSLCSRLDDVKTPRCKISQDHLRLQENESWNMNVKSGPRHYSSEKVWTFLSGMAWS